jgi:hypothetical protein
LLNQQFFFFDLSDVNGHCHKNVIANRIRMEVSERSLQMSAQALFGISVPVSFIAWAVVMRQYVWPAVRSQSRTNALRPILLLHSFRFVGLAFLVPGVVSPDLPAAYARPAAYGDLATAILALLAIAALRNKLGIILVWAFNLPGTADLLHAFHEGNRTGVGLAPGMQGAAYFIPTVLVPTPAHHPVIHESTRTATLAGSPRRKLLRPWRSHQIPCFAI